MNAESGAEEDVFEGTSFGVADGAVLCPAAILDGVVADATGDEAGLSGGVALLEDASTLFDFAPEVS